MKVRFLKYCPWSYRITRGQLKKHLEDSFATVPDVEGDEMVGAGYAVEVVNKVKPEKTFKPSKKKVVEPEEKKVVAPAEKKLADMTSKELEIEGRKHGVELDRRKKTGTLRKELQAVIGGKE